MIIICCIISPYFSHRVFKEFSQHIKYYSPHIFPTGFLEDDYQTLKINMTTWNIFKIIQGIQDIQDVALCKGEC